jgi:hypothetical protein
LLGAGEDRGSQSVGAIRFQHHRGFDSIVYRIHCVPMRFHAHSVNAMVRTTAIGHVAKLFLDVFIFIVQRFRAAQAFCIFFAPSEFVVSQSAVSMR